MGYGPDELYVRWSARSLELWQEFFRQTGQTLLHRTGVLWLAAPGNMYVAQAYEVLTRLNLPVERLSQANLRQRYPQINFEDVEWGFLEPQSGVLMARRAVQAVVEAAVKDGVTYLPFTANTPDSRDATSMITREGTSLSAKTFIYCCGPWLPKIFPELLGERIFPTRQEVFFFGTPPGSSDFSLPRMPTWIDLDTETYGMPDLENRGFK